MAKIQEKLAESLAVLKKYQDAHGDNLVIQGADTLGRTHTERLVDSGYLQMVIRGWYIPSSPGSEGDSTVWYVSYWSFITAYLDNRFDGKWCLSPEMSLYFHSGKTVIPRQLIVRSESGTNNILQLPFGTSIVDIKASLPPEVVQEPRYGVRLYPMEYALLMMGPDYYRHDALEARSCLASLKDVSPIVSAAIDGGHTTRAGRVAGALRSIGREEMADELRLALVHVLLAEGAVLCLDGVTNRLLVVFVGNHRHALLDLFIAEVEVTEHLPYLDAAPVVVTELVVAIGPGKALVVDVLLLLEIVHDVVGVLN